MLEVQDHVSEDIRWMKQCPRWLNCSVNVCPLDPNRGKRQIDAHDPETTCKSNIRERLEIIAKAQLEGVELGDGMTAKERKSGKTVEDLVAERDAISARNREKGLRLHGKTTPGTAQGA